MDHLLDPAWTYLNHGSFGSTPRQLLDAQRALIDEMERQPVAFLHRQLRPRLLAQKQALAPFLGADVEGLSFVTNATTGVAAVLHSLAETLREGDELLTTDHRYGAVGNAMLATARRTGARVVEAALPYPITSPDQVVDAVAAAITPRTRLLVVDWITSPTALVLPVAELCALARDRGVPVLVDGAHTPGQVEVDLARVQPDFYTGNLHKWLCAPKGSAVLWVAEPWRGRVQHPVPSHGLGQGLAAEFDWAGTFDPTAWLCSTAALAHHDAQGGAAFRAANHQLLVRAGALLRERLDLPRHAPDAMRGAMLTLPLPWPTTAHARVQDALHAARFEVPVVTWGERLWFRISAMSAYNHLDQYDRLARTLMSWVAHGLEAVVSPR